MFINICNQAEQEIELFLTYSTISSSHLLESIFSLHPKDWGHLLKFRN